MGHYPTDDELKTLMSRIDTDNSGAVDFEEFAAVMANRMDVRHLTAFDCCLNYFRFGSAALCVYVCIDLSAS